MEEKITTEWSHIVKLFNRVKGQVAETGVSDVKLVGIVLTEHLTHDYCWVAEAKCFFGDNDRKIEIEGSGLEAHEALLDLIENIKRRAEGVIKIK